MIRDNTQRHEAEQALRESEERLRLATKVGKMYACEIDLTSQTFKWSENAKDLVGFPMPETMTKFWASVHPEDRAEAVQTFEQAVKGVGEFELEYRVINPATGKVVWVFSAGVVVAGADGSPVRVVGVAQNITERKQAEEALRELNEMLERRVEERTRKLVQSYEALRRSEQRFSQAFFTSPVATALSTLDEDRFIEVNNAFCRLTGYSREEAVGRAAKDLRMWASPEDQETLRRAKQEHSSLRDLELTLTTKDGDTRSILKSTAIVPDSGGQLMLKMFYDITERKRSEEQLLHAIEEVMKDTTWFSSAIVEKLAQVRSGRTDAPMVAELTARERQLLVLIAKGMNNQRIAKELNLKEQTVRNYTTSVYSKLNIHSRTEAVVWARERGLA